MEKITIILLMLVALKSFFVGSNFNIYKWIKEGKSYIKKYNEWLDKCP
jgi:hypothetical protein